MSKIKVCHMTSVHGQEDVRIFHKECISLANAGYSVYEIAHGNTYKKNNVNIIGIGKFPNSRFERIIKSTKLIYQKALELDCDIYHIHDPELLYYALKLKRKGKKVIFDSHEYYVYQIKEKHYLPKIISGLFAKIYQLYERHVLRYIDAVISPCTLHGKNPFEGLCKRTYIISNAAKLDEFYYNYNPNSSKVKNQVCYIGSLTEARGITINMHAAYNVGATLALAGTFSPREYFEAISKSKSFSSIDYRGELGRKQIVNLVSESNVGLCTFLDKGQYLHLDTFGVKVYEYLSMGLPVILSKSPYNNIMAQKYGFAICVEPNNIAETANAIKFLLENPNIAKKMGLLGRKAIKDFFNWNFEEKKLIELYKQLL